MLKEYILETIEQQRYYIIFLLHIATRFNQF